MEQYNIQMESFSVKIFIMVTIIESIYGWASIAYAWYFKGSLWFVFGPGFVYSYNECLLGIWTLIPLLFSIIIVKQFEFYPGINNITKRSVLFIFGKDFRPFKVGCSALILALVAGIGEEMFFRAIIQEELSVLMSEPIGIIISVLLFGAMHAITFGYAILASLAGLYFSWLYIACGRSILVAAVSHTLYDWFVFSMVHYKVTHDEYL